MKDVTKRKWRPSRRVWQLSVAAVACALAGLLGGMLKKPDYYDAKKVRASILEANPGLGAVLKLYEGDSLKYAATLYLIDNLGYHQGMDSADMRGLYAAYELFATGRYGYQQAMDSAYRLYGTSGVRDVRWCATLNGLSRFGASSRGGRTSLSPNSASTCCLTAWATRNWSHGVRSSIMSSCRPSSGI